MGDGNECDSFELGSDGRLDERVGREVDGRGRLVEQVAARSRAGHISQCSVSSKDRRIERVRATHILDLRTSPLASATSCLCPDDRFSPPAVMGVSRLIACPPGVVVPSPAAASCSPVSPDDLRAA